MIVSRGDLKYTTLWTGTTQSWGSWPAQLQLGNQWASYSTIYRRQHWVRTCVDKRAALLSRLPLKVYRHDDMNRPEENTDPYARLLARPNPKVSRFWFWMWIQSTYDIFGEAFIGKIRDRGGRPYELALLHPTGMHEADERDGRVIWEFDNGKVHLTNIPDEDLIHLHTYNPDSLCRGLSKLESLRSTLENEDAALRAQSAFWRNGARPGVALTHPGKLSEPAANRLKLRWDQIAGGADNTGRTVVLEEGMKPEILQLSAEEAQYIDSRRLNREEVVAGFDMPPPAVHILDNATYSNITEQMRSVYRDTMTPVTVSHEAELETQLRGSIRPGASGPDFSDDVYAEFLLDGVLRGDFEQRADAYQKAINSGWTTPAEVRKLENLPFIEGSDRLYINSTMVPMPSEDADETEDTFDPRLVEAVGVLIRSGFEPAAILAALGLPSIEHLGLLPITLQPEEVFDATAEAAEAGTLDEAAMRMVMGRLSRPKSLEEIDRDALTDGLNGGTRVVLDELDAAIAAGEGVMSLRARIKHLADPSVGSRTTEQNQALALLRAITAPPARPRRYALRRDDSGTFIGLEEELVDGSR